MVTNYKLGMVLDCNSCLKQESNDLAPCESCERNPRLENATHLQDRFVSIVGDHGDCGNWAIAYQRKHGGTLHAVWDGGDVENGEVIEPRIIGHVVVWKDGLVIDVYGSRTCEEFYKDLDRRWGYTSIDLEIVSEAEIFKQLKLTSEARIAELMEAMSI